MAVVDLIEQAEKEAAQDATVDERLANTLGTNAVSTPGGTLPLSKLVSNTEGLSQWLLSYDRTKIKNQLSGKDAEFLRAEKDRLITGLQRINQMPLEPAAPEYLGPRGRALRSIRYGMDPYAELRDKQKLAIARLNASMNTIATIGEINRMLDVGEEDPRLAAQNAMVKSYGEQLGATMGQLETVRLLTQSLEQRVGRPATDSEIEQIFRSVTGTQVSQQERDNRLQAMGRVAELVQKWNVPKEMLPPEYQQFYDSLAKNKQPIEDPVNLSQAMDDQRLLTKEIYDASMEYQPMIDPATNQPIIDMRTFAPVMREVPTIDWTEASRRATEHLMKHPGYRKWLAPGAGEERKEQPGGDKERIKKLDELIKGAPEK